MMPSPIMPTVDAIRPSESAADRTRGSIDTRRSPLEYRAPTRKTQPVSNRTPKEVTMHTRRFARTAFAAAILVAAGTAGADNIKLRIASGHPPANTYVNLMQNFFVPEVTKRVKEKTKHTVEFVEGYGGSMVKVADTLEGVQSGIIDVGGYCFCFEPSNLPLHAFQVMLPFGTMSPVKSVQLARNVYNKVPSVMMIVWGVLTEQAIGKIFIAGILSGLLLTAFYCFYIVGAAGDIRSWRVPTLSSASS
jgi:hypothetical protein